MADEPVQSRFVSDGKVDFHYQKTSQYRGIHADGFWGGSTPRGVCAISFFSERQPIPRHAQRPVVAKDGVAIDLGPEEVTEVLSGVVRQVETTLYMDLRTMQELYSWLGPVLAGMEDAQGVPPEERVGKGQA